MASTPSARRWSAASWRQRFAINFGIELSSRCMSGVVCINCGTQSRRVCACCGAGIGGVAASGGMGMGVALGVDWVLV